MSIVTIIGSHKGGVGCTTLATLLADLSRAAGERHLDIALEQEIADAPKSGKAQKRQNSLERLCEISRAAARDTDVLSVEFEFGGNTQSVLRRKLGCVIPVPISQSMDQCFELLSRDFLSGSALVDLGPGLLAPWLAWATQTELGRKLASSGIRLDFITVSTPDRAALGLAADALTGARKAFGRFDLDFRGYVVHNEVQTSFDKLVGTDEWDRLGSVLSQGKRFRSLRFPAAWSELITQFESSDLLPTQISALSDEEVEDRWRVMAVEARRGGDDYLDWVLTAAEELLAAGLLDLRMEPLSLRWAPKSTTEF